MLSNLKHRMVIVEDLVDKTNGNLVDKLVHVQDCCYEKKPKKCPVCMDNDITGIEIMGARNGILLWECEECSEMFLRYGVRETEKELQGAKEYWTNHRDWGYVPRRKFN